MPELDERLMIAVVDPSRDTIGHWRDDLEALEFRRFHDLDFVTDIAQHRYIYDPVLPITLFLVVGWLDAAAAMSRVLTVCRVMRSHPDHPLPVIAAVDSGQMHIDQSDALVSARTRPGAAVEATICSVPPDERPAAVARPTAVAHGLFMALADVAGCEWILSAVDPGALTHAHADSSAGHLIEIVGSGEDTVGVESQAIAMRVAPVLAALPTDPRDPTAAGLIAGRRLLLAA